MPQSDIEALLASCDRATLDGARDHAMLMLLARLGLRSIEIARLQLEDLDWRAGDLLVRGKARRDDRLPIPDDVGAALAEYLALRGPPRLTACVFLTLRAPTRPIRADLGRRCRAAPLPAGGCAACRAAPAQAHARDQDARGRRGAVGHQPGAASQRSRDHRDLRQGRPRPPAAGRPAVARSSTMTVLAAAPREYLQLRRTLGHKLADAHRLLPRFVTYLDDHDIEFVTVEAALAWSLEREVPVGSVVPAHRMMVGARVRALPVRDRPADRGSARGNDPPSDSGGGGRSSTPTLTCSR